MNDNVVQLHTPKIGDHTFMVCDCNPQEPQPFVPVVILQQNPVVVGLQCPACEQYLTVINGVIQEPVPGQLSPPSDQFKVCFAPGQFGQARCTKQCVKCKDAEQQCTCGAAWGSEINYADRLKCPYHYGNSYNPANIPPPRQVRDSEELDDGC